MSKLCMTLMAVSLASLEPMAAALTVPVTHLCELVTPSNFFSFLSLLASCLYLESSDYLITGGWNQLVDTARFVRTTRTINVTLKFLALLVSFMFSMLTHISLHCWTIK
jgi:hypothetical protein